MRSTISFAIGALFMASFAAEFGALIVSDWPGGPTIGVAGPVAVVIAWVAAAPSWPRAGRRALVVACAITALQVAVVAVAVNGLVELHDELDAGAGAAWDAAVPWGAWSLGALLVSIAVSLGAYAVLVCAVGGAARAYVLTDRRRATRLAVLAAALLPIVIETAASAADGGTLEPAVGGAAAAWLVTGLRQRRDQIETTDDASAPGHRMPSTA